MRDTTSELDQDNICQEIGEQDKTHLICVEFTSELIKAYQSREDKMLASKRRKEQNQNPIFNAPFREWKKAT
jgi:hypothetical protein